MTSVASIENNHDFSDGTVAAEDKVEAAALDAQLSDVKNKINAFLAAVGLVIRDDDTLVDEIVRLRNLHPEIIALIAANDAWLPKISVACASTANLALTGEQTIDGVLTSASRILVKDQTAGAENGIYVTGAGAWTRATDADTAAELGLAAVLVLAGTQNANSAWVQTVVATAITLDTTSLVWAQFAGQPGITPEAKGGTGLTDRKAWPTYLRRRVRVVASSSVSLAAPGASIDGVALAAGDRVLLTAQVTGSQNGLWVWNGAAIAMSRPVDFPAASTTHALQDVEVEVSEGSGYAGSLWRITTTAAITIDTTAHTWTQLQPAARSTASTTARTLAARFAEAANAKDFGAVGDGASHPLSGLFATLGAAQAVYAHAAALTDELDGVAIQAAINANRRVYVPKGTYLVNVSIDPASSNQWIEGDGVNASGGSVLKWNGAASGIIMYAPGGASRLHGLRFDGGNIAGTVGVKCDDTHRPGYACWGTTRFYQCLGIGFDCSVSNPSGSNGIYYNQFGHMTAEQCGKGIRLATLVAANARVNANSWQHANVQNSVTLGLEINLADGNTWGFLEAETNDVGVDVVKGNYNVAFGGWLEGNTTWHLRIADNPDVTHFEYHGACTQDSKISYVNSDNRSLIIPTQNSYHRYLAGRWFAELLQVQAWGGTLVSKLSPNALTFNRPGAHSFLDQIGIAGGLQLRTTAATDGDTPMVGIEPNKLGFGPTKAAAPVTIPINLTGSRGGNAAVASIIALLVALGVATDSTS